jgi:hypothetical protein
MIKLPAAVLASAGGLALLMPGPAKAVDLFSISGGEKANQALIWKTDYLPESDSYFSQPTDYIQNSEFEEGLPLTTGNFNPGSLGLYADFSANLAIPAVGATVRVQQGAGTPGAPPAGTFYSGAQAGAYAALGYQVYIGDGTNNGTMADEIPLLLNSFGYMSLTSFKDAYSFVDTDVTLSQDFISHGFPNPFSLNSHHSLEMSARDHTDCDINGCTTTPGGTRTMVSQR